MSPAYNFKRRYARLIVRGVKRQTIRPVRHHRPTVKSDVLYLYVGQRTKDCELVLKTLCLSVSPIVITDRQVFLDGLECNEGEVDFIWQQDGFYSEGGFRRFFRDTYGLPFRGEVIIWGGRDLR